MSQSFILHRDNTRDRVLSNALRFLQMLPADKAWKIEVSQYAKRRSDNQNKYLWGAVYPAFMQCLTGWDAEDVHEYLLGEWSGWDRIEGMGRVRLKPCKRSSKLTTAEFKEYTEFCQRKGAEYGIFVPDPE